MGIKSEGIQVKANTKLVGCLYELGGIKMSRNATKKKCMTSGEIKTILDAIETGDLNLSVAYDPTDTAGATELNTVFDSGAELTLAIELSDTAGANGTTFTWTTAVVTEFEIDPDADGEVGANFTVSPGGKPAVTPAA